MVATRPRSPLEGMVWQNLTLRREYPYSPPNFPHPPALRCLVTLEVEFDDEEAAIRLEGKMRKLLESDNMIVVRPIGTVQVARGEPVPLVAEDLKLK